MRIPYRRNPVTLGPAALGALRQILGSKYGRSPTDVEGILALVQDASALLPEGDPATVAGRVLGALEGILAVYDEPDETEKEPRSLIDPKPKGDPYDPTLDERNRRALQDYYRSFGSTVHGWINTIQEPSGAGNTSKNRQELLVALQHILDPQRENELQHAYPPHKRQELRNADVELKKRAQEVYDKAVRDELHMKALFAQVEQARTQAAAALDAAKSETGALTLNETLRLLDNAKDTFAKASNEVEQEIRTRFDSTTPGRLVYNGVSIERGQLSREMESYQERARALIHKLHEQDRKRKATGAYPTLLAEAQAAQHDPNTDTMQEEVRLKQAADLVHQGAPHSVFTYGLRSRPPGLGSTPPGDIAYTEAPLPGAERFTRYGTLSYALPLSDATLKRYGLIPKLTVAQVVEHFFHIYPQERITFLAQNLRHDPKRVRAWLKEKLESVLPSYISELNPEDMLSAVAGALGLEGAGLNSPKVPPAGTSQPPSVKAPEGYPPTLPGEDASLLYELVRLGATDFERVTSPRLWALNESRRALDIIPYLLRQMPDDPDWLKWLSRVKRRMETIETVELVPEEIEIFDLILPNITQDVVLAYFKHKQATSLGKAAIEILNQIERGVPLEESDPFFALLRATAERRVAEHMHNLQTQGKLRIQWSPGGEGVYVREKEPQEYSLADKVGRRGEVLAFPGVPTVSIPTPTQSQMNAKQSEQRIEEVFKQHGGYTSGAYLQLFKEIESGLLDPETVNRKVSLSIADSSYPDPRTRALALLARWQTMAHPTGHLPAQWQVPQDTFPKDAYPGEHVVTIQKTRENAYDVMLGTAQSDWNQMFETSVYKGSRYKTLKGALKAANDYLNTDSNRRGRKGNVAIMADSDIQPYVAPVDTGP